MSKKERIIIILLFFLALFIRLYFAFTDNRPIEGDQLTYDRLALSILKYHSLLTYRGIPTAYNVPLYQLFLAGIYLLFGHSYLWVKIIQGVLGAFVCLILYFITRGIFGKRVAFIAFLLAAVHYFFISYGVLLFTENLFIFFVSLSVLFLFKFTKSHSYLNACLFGLFSSLATLTRSAYFLFPFFVIIILFMARRDLKIKFNNLIKLQCCIVLSFLLPISIWTGRNFLVFKRFIPLATEFGVVFYSSYNPPQGKIFDVSTQDRATCEYAKLPEVEGNRFLIKETLSSIKKEPSKLYKYIPLKLMYFFSIFEWAAFRLQGAYNFSWAFIMPLSFFGIIFASRKKGLYLNLLPLLPVIYFVIITVMIMGVPRTRLPVEPYLIVYAALSLNYIYERVRYKGLVIYSVLLWYVLNYFVYLNSEKAKFIIKVLLEKLSLW